MVVDDIEDDRDAESMSAVDEMAEIIRPAVEPGGREEVDAVVSPTEPARKLRHGHNFEAGYAELGESRQLVRGGFPTSPRGESADMHLVDDELFAWDATPCVVGPGESLGIDDFRRSVRSSGLK